ncbi:hypothetical protein [Salinigranum rubrum]|uniref:hypothetical protein n=1 Tax=Salinigranum rubrum TaxID=755307 RepID=UPI002AA29EC2|nr:hypothetical protein [Salinigranum rubrum]
MTPPASGAEKYGDMMMALVQSRQLPRISLRSSAANRPMINWRSVVPKTNTSVQPNANWNRSFVRSHA